MVVLLIIKFFILVIMKNLLYFCCTYSTTNCIKNQEFFEFSLNLEKTNDIDNLSYLCRQAVDKCRNCMSQQPILMRKSAENVII